MFLDRYEGESHIWCLHCERVWPVEYWQSNGFHCPGQDCDGSPIDAWPWSKLADGHNHYPEHPATGGGYPLYCDRLECRDQTFLFALDIKDSIALEDSVNAGRRVGVGWLYKEREYGQSAHWRWRGNGYDHELTVSEAEQIANEWSFFGCSKIKLRGHWYRT